jgi:hypothetical protein
LGPERDIDDPALQRMKLGPDVEPPENELLKGPPDADDVAATGGPAAPATGVGAARRMGPKAFLQILGPGLAPGRVTTTRPATALPTDRHRSRPP